MKQVENSADEVVALIDSHIGVHDIQRQHPMFRSEFGKKDGFDPLVRQL